MPLEVHPNDRGTFWSRRWRLEHMYPIKTEDRGLRLLSMDERPIQNVLFGKAEAKAFRSIRLINLKGRKQGVTTFWSLYYLDDTLFVPNTTSCIIAHKEKDVKKIFRIVKTAYHRAPSQIRLSDGKVWQKPEANYDNVNELIFEGINSTIYVALESRGDTNNNLHISEAAHIPDAENRMAGTLESVPNIEYGSNITIESTAAGVGGWFYDTWQASKTGETGYDPVFFPWFFKPTNRLSIPSDFYPTADEEKLIAKVAKEYNTLLSPEQVFWWRMKKGTQRKLMNQEHPTFEDDAFMSSDMMVFDDIAVKNVRPKNPIRMMRVKLEKGFADVSIFVEPKPGRRYVIGADPAEGVNGDASVAEVYDAVTLEQVAEFHSKTTSPGDFGEFVLPAMGRLYNEAMIAIERNNHGHTVIDRIKRVYTRLFMMQTFDERTNKRTKKIGWLTHGHTRDLMLDDFEEVVNDGTVTVNGAILKSEMLTFVTNPDGKREAKVGKHDDTVMASAIAVKVARMPRNSYGVYEIS